MINNYSIPGIIAHQKEQCHSEGAQRATVGIYIRNLSPEQTLLLWIATLTLAMTWNFYRILFFRLSSTPTGWGTRRVVGVFWIVRNVERLEINPLRLRRTPPCWGRTIALWNLWLDLFYKKHRRFRRCFFNVFVVRILPVLRPSLLPMVVPTYVVFRFRRRK